MTQPAGGPELQAWDSHYPIVCRSCGAVADVACVFGHAPCLEPASRAGYTIDDAEVTFRGLCAACRDAVGDTCLTAAQPADAMTS